LENVVLVIGAVCAGLSDNMINWCAKAGNLGIIGLACRISNINLKASFHILE